MAIPTLPLFLIALSLFTLTASARPCKTIFFYTTTTTTSYYPQNPNPNFDNFPFQKFPSYSPKSLTFFITTTKTHEENHPFVSYLSFRRTPFALYYSTGEEKLLDGGEDEVAEDKRSDESVMPFGNYYLFSTSSIKDRTKDIMSVVGALLFGVGCGALTAATMFLIWSLFTPHRFDFEDSDDDDDRFDNGHDDVGPKKFGYVAIPEDVDAVKKNFTPQKEVV